MKKTFLLALSVVWTFVVHGQDVDSVVYQSVFGDSVARWYEHQGNWDYGGCADAYEIFTNDTLSIDGISYKILRWVDLPYAYDVCHYHSYDNLLILFRESETHDKLFFRQIDPQYLDTTPELTIMDLSLNVGDTMGLSGGYPVVATIDSVFYRSGRKILRTMYENAGDTLFFIEGVGPSFGMTYVQNVPNHLFQISLVCYYRDTTFEYHDNVIYPDWGCEVSYESGIDDDQRDVDALVTASPNPTTGIVNVETSMEEVLRIKVVSSEGRILLKKTAHEIRSVVDLTGFPVGVYFLCVEGESKCMIKKMIKI